MRGALTAGVEEAHPPQEEAGIHMAQGLLHVLETGVARPGQENKPEEDKLHNRDSRAPVSLIQEVREQEEGDRKTAWKNTRSFSFL